MKDKTSHPLPQTLTIAAAAGTGSGCTQHELYIMMITNTLNRWREGEQGAKNYSSDTNTCCILLVLYTIAIWPSCSPIVKICTYSLTACWSCCTMTIVPLGFSIPTDDVLYWRKSVHVCVCVCVPNCAIIWSY